MAKHGAIERVKGIFRPAKRWAKRAASHVAAEVSPADLSVFHEFHEPPFGGGNQFLLTLVDELSDRGYRIEKNRVSRTTEACLFNSFNFDFDLLQSHRREGCRFVHRVDGPVDVYRGAEGRGGIDEKIWKLNQEIADATIFQSRYSLEKHEDLGMEFVDPHVVHNAPNPTIFQPNEENFDRDTKTRLISTSWSDNPNKGAPVYQRIEALIDWDRYEWTFVGRAPVEFERIRHIDPVPPSQVGELLRAHDIFVSASLHESCSNSLLEALACGLPAVCVDSGSHAELVEGGGELFEDESEIPDLLDEVVEDYESYRANISTPGITETADRYLSVLNSS